MELEWIVVDEAHELLSSERGSQLSLSMKRLQLNSKLSLSKTGLSATVGNLIYFSGFYLSSTS